MFFHISCQKIVMPLVLLLLNKEKYQKKPGRTNINAIPLLSELSMQQNEETNQVNADTIKRRRKAETVSGVGLLITIGPFSQSATTLKHSRSLCFGWA